MTRSLLSRDPFADLERMVDQMDRAFDGFWRPSQPIAGTIPVDIYEKDNSLFVCAAVPGVTAEDLDVSIENNVLTIRGETKQNWESGESTKVYRREHRYGSFTRSIRLFDGLDLENVDAEFNNGFVTIRIPKQPEEKPAARKVQVRSVGQRQEQQVLTQNAGSKKSEASKN